MDSKAQLEAEIRQDSTKPEYQDAIKQLRARKEERGTRLVKVYDSTNLAVILCVN
jgi:hypothetical protein